MDAVSVIIAGVALDLHRVGQRGVFESPLVRFPAFTNVIDQLKALQMLVRFAVELGARKSESSIDLIQLM